MRYAAIALGICWLAALAQAADAVSHAMLVNWPAWRGPEANGVAPLAKPPVTWDENTNVKWKVEIPGEGDASPIVWNDKVFLVTAVKTDREGKPEPDPVSDELRKKSPSLGARAYGITTPDHYYQFVVMCLDRGTGRVVWQDMANEVVPHEGRHPDGSYASASPATDGRRVYVSFGSRGVHCYDMQGKKLWSRDFGRMTIFNTFGEGCSPVVHGDSVIVNWDHQGQSFIVCLDAATGETKWKVDRDETSTWATPLLIESANGTQVVTNGTLRVRSYDLASGELLWACGGQGPSAIPSPVTDGRRAIAMTGFITNSLYAIPLEARGDITGQDDQIAWSTRKVASSYVPSPLLYGKLLYFTAGNKGILSCYDVESGEPVLTKQRLQGISNIYASPVGADNRIYITSREGTTVVIENGKFVEEDGKNRVEIIATNKLDEQFDASAAVAGGELFLRGKAHLYCIADE